MASRGSGGAGASHGIHGGGRCVFACHLAAVHGWPDVQRLLTLAFDRSSASLTQCPCLRWLVYLRMMRRTRREVISSIGVR